MLYGFVCQMSLIIFKINQKLAILLLVFVMIERLEEEVTDVVCGKGRLARDTHELKHRPSNLKVVFDNGNEAIGEDSDVYLNSDSIFRLTPETFDLEMLFNPLEEQFHLSPILIKESNVLSSEHEVVRVVDKASVQLWGVIYNSPDSARIFLLVLLLGEANALVHEPNT